MKSPYLFGLLVSCLLIISECFSQNTNKPDLIYRLDQSVIKATVVEVTDQEIVYQTFGDKKGQKLQLPVKSISKIVYANGDVETYNDIATQPKPLSAKLDKIVLKNRQQIEGTIVEVDEKNISYRKKGQTIINKIGLPQVAQIIYNNGETETFGQPNAPNTPSPTNSTGRSLSIYAGGGINLAHQTLPDALQSWVQPIMGYRAMLGTEWQIHKHLALRLEANYAQQGMKLVFENDYEQLMANYLKVPLLLQGQVAFGKFGLHANVGAFGGYWLSATTTSMQNQQKYRKTYVFNQFLDRGLADNRIEYGACGGVGASYAIGRSNLFLESRYDYGLSDITKYDPKPDEYHQTTNRGFGLIFGYRFRL
ncbi:hypothetical protein FHS57_006044 [Runella defluvii]|uniref:Outer membrane protein beta-barrel domain-containing protein n=1 Tax=Runella defluvii TaxID=370973 RepID=A0A7W5ZQX9_9BACT|nr:porin family protein [Runella defluvii]MBB3842015.1 hypothetical protein [Runella defluvii]